jgi:hypothetical protein
VSGIPEKKVLARRALEFRCMGATIDTKYDHYGRKDEEGQSKISWSESSDIDNLKGHTACSVHPITRLLDFYTGLRDDIPGYT